MSKKILIEKNKKLKLKPQTEDLGFGKYFTDYMFVMDFSTEIGWHDPKIVPYDFLKIDPAAAIFHYGQATFEGLKAYKTKYNKIFLFRPYENIKRMNISNARLAIPSLDEDLIFDAIKTLVNLEKDWIPENNNLSSLYIRPFVIATEPFLGIRASNLYKFMIILTPVSAYYLEGINPISLDVETKYSRSGKNGVGYAKTPGNYAASIKVQMDAKQKGYSQVLWLDACEKKYIEEVGTMNIFFKINEEIITPSLENGTILDGITRKSVVELLKSWNIKCTERQISIDEIYEAYKNETLEEIFGTGTAAIVSPIGKMNINNNLIQINSGKTGPLSSKIYNTLINIQTGNTKDEYNWIIEI